MKRRLLAGLSAEFYAADLAHLLLGADLKHHNLLFAEILIQLTMRWGLNCLPLSIMVRPIIKLRAVWISSKS